KGVRWMDKEMEESMMGAIENVIDPELGIDIVNLGLVYGVNLDEDGNAGVEMTLTSMGCPMGPQIINGVKQALAELPEVKRSEERRVGNDGRSPRRPAAERK